MIIFKKTFWVCLLVISFNVNAQIAEGDWYVSSRAGVVSTTLYNNDDFTNYGNSVANSWYSTGDYDILSLNSGFYGIYTGYSINNNIILETGIYSYRLRQNYERNSQDLQGKGIVRDHITVLKFLRMPLILKAGFDFRDDNFLYVYGGLAGGYLYDYFDYSESRDIISGRKTFEQKISNGSYEKEYYEISHQRETGSENGIVTGLYNDFSFSVLGGIGFQFRLADNWMGEVFARSELDIFQIEDHSAEYIHPDGSRSKIWNGRVRHPEDPANAGSPELRQKTIPFSIGLGVGIIYNLEG